MEMKLMGRLTDYLHPQKVSLYLFINNFYKQLNLNMPFQRNYVWSNEQKSALIHSILIGFPIQNIILADNGEEIIVIDGKQRIKTIVDFANDKFALEESTKTLLGINVSLMKFSDLPTELKKYFYETELTLLIYKGIPQQDITEMYIRLNTHSPVPSFIKKTYESNLIDKVVDLANLSFFKNHFPVTPNVKSTQVINQIIIITSMILDSDKLQIKSISTNETNQYLDILSQNDMSLRTDELIKISEYMDAVSTELTVREKRKIFKKVDTIPILVLAHKIMNLNIKPQSFAEFLKYFFSSGLANNVDYLELKKEGYTKIPNIENRISILEKSLNDFISQQ
jgi:hypothetical protein